MKNLFDYATKELSQDAFLCWLFENYNCEKKAVRDVAYLVLNSFCDLEMSDGDIERLKTYRQYEKMDVIVRFEYDSRVYLVVIEDKTYSGEHDQLMIYDKKLISQKTKDEFILKKDSAIKKVFYKTDLANEKDRFACENSNWKMYFIDEIIDLFKNVNEVDCEILDDYVSHIRSVRNKTINISNKPMGEWDIINHRTYFIKEILPEIFQNTYWKKQSDIIFPGWYSYYSIALPFWIPKTSYRITMEIKTMGMGIQMLIRASDFKTAQEEQLPTEIKNSLLNHFEKKSNGFFTKYNKKWSVATLSKKIKNELLYTNYHELSGRDDLKNKIIEIVMLYEKLCVEYAYEFEEKA